MKKVYYCLFFMDFLSVYSQPTELKVLIIVQHLTANKMNPFLLN